MSYNFQYEPSQKLVRITNLESTNFDDKLEQLKRMIELLKREPTARVLVDSRLQGSQITEQEQIEFGMRVGKSGKYFRYSKIAVITRPRGYYIANAMMYAEGMLNVAEFDDERDAMEWLDSL